jgi:hypothetical protein
MIYHFISVLEASLPYLFIYRLQLLLIKPYINPHFLVGIYHIHYSGMLSDKD